jgi:hypothetical protein
VPNIKKTVFKTRKHGLFFLLFYLIIGSMFGPIFTVHANMQPASLIEVESVVYQMQYLPSDEYLEYEKLELSTSFHPLFISKTDAKEDTERLFYLLENGYAGYGYFNINNLYQEAKDAIISEIDGKTILTRSDLSTIFYKNLNFLHDCHLTIGEHEYKTHLDYWYNTDFEVIKENQEYKFTFEDKVYTITSINNQSPDDFLYPSLNSNGDSMYRIGTLSKSAPEILELLAENNEGLGRWSVALKNSQPAYSEIYIEKEMGGIPVIRIRSFSDQHKEYIDKFLTCAGKYRETPCLIVDIRGNGGGNTAYARQWITRYTGDTPVLPQIYSELVSETSMMGRSNYFADMLQNYPELKAQGYDQKTEQFKGYAEEIENGEVNIHWSNYNVPNPRTIANNRTLIVLMDKNVGSAAEGFLSYLQLVENVIYIGENSGGALTYGQMTRHMLPHSKILVDLPISLNVFVDLEYREEKGFYPDLWVPSEDALNFAVAAVRSGSIETSKEYRAEIMEYDFVPEIKPVKNIILSYIPLLFGVFYGVILVYYNWKRKSRVFFIAGLAGILVGIIFPFKLELGSIFIIVGIEYLGIAIYKWRNEHRTQRKHNLHTLM